MGSLWIRTVKFTKENPRKFYLIGFVAITIAFAIFYLRTFSYSFVWDDQTYIEKNKNLTKPPLLNMFRPQGAQQGEMEQHSHFLRAVTQSFRPTEFLSHWLDVHIFGMDAYWMKVSSYLVFSICLFFAGLLIFEFFGSNWLAFAGIVFWAVHPLSVEPIVYISGRGDLLSGLFALISFWFALKVLKKERYWRWILLSTLAYLFSLFSKEGLLGLPLAILLIGIPFTINVAGKRKRLATLFIVQVGASIFYLLIRDLVIHIASGRMYFKEAIIQVPGLMMDFWSSFFQPLHLSVGRLYDSRWMPVGWFILVLALSGFIFLIVQRKVKKDLTVALCFFLAVPVLLGPSAVEVMDSKVAADRYYFIPVLFSIICVMFLFIELFRQVSVKKPIFIFLFSFVFLGFFLLSWKQMEYWKSNRSLFKREVEEAPQNAMGYYRLSTTYKDINRTVPLLEYAIRLDPNNQLALNNLGIYAMRSERLDYAIELFTRAIEHGHSVTIRPFYNRALAYLKRGNLEFACSDLRRALMMNGSYQKARDLWDQICRTSVK